MNIGVTKAIGDSRVAIVPASIKKITDLGVNVLIEDQAGADAHFSNEAYEDAGASILDHTALLQQSDAIISIQPLSSSEWESGKLYISQFAPFNEPSIVDQLQEKGANALSLDMIPRTTLAQSMDILSSMASIAGYRAVLEATKFLPRYLPMMITAAGTIKPSTVVVLGAGVAGLQSIATARRLGAIVEAFDTRQAAKEEVLSLGAKFIDIEGATEDKGAGGYAVAQSEDFIKRQQAEVQNRASKADIVICTAQVRGRKAPLLIPKATVERMKPGSVIVDLASSTGGNCELSVDNEVIEAFGVTIIGNSNLSSGMPQDASVLYSNNLVNFLKIFVKEGKLAIDTENEILKSALITSPAQLENLPK